ncbi:MAG: methyltransferase family protein [Chloroflexota bacterium]
MRAVAARAIIGLTQLVLVLGAALFAPAWTFDFWQAWVYLLVFAASTILITLYLWNKDPQLLQRRLKAGPRAEHEHSQQVIQLLASAAFVGLFVVSSLDRRFSWSHVASFVSIGADIVVVLGFFIVLLVFRENTFTAATIEVAQDQAVISSGPYAFVRHPMYAGALLMLLGTPVALGSWWALVMFSVLFVAIVWRLREEERFLSGNLDGYAEYRARVHHRLVPLIW